MHPPIRFDRHGLPQPPDGSSRSGRVLAPALDDIIKNAAWHKHSNLVSSCKATLDGLEVFSVSPDQSSPLAIESAYPIVAETALRSSSPTASSAATSTSLPTPTMPPGSSAARFLTSVCSCCGIGDEALELSMLRVLIASVRSPFVLIRYECLAQIFQSCYNVYLGSQSGANQLCAKLVPAQIVVIMFTRVETYSPDVRIRIVSIADMMDLSDRNLNGSSLVQSAHRILLMRQCQEATQTPCLLNQTRRALCFAIQKERRLQMAVD